MTTFDTTNQTGEQLRDHTDNLKSDVAAVKEDVGAIARHAGGAMKEQAERVADVADSGREKANELHESLCRTVSKNPTASVAAAVGVGLVLGRLLGGR